MQKAQQYFIIDFDSTFIKSEGLDELAAVALKKTNNKQKIIERIKLLTQEGMEGKISFEKSLNERITLLKANRTHVEKTATKLKKNISSSIMRNKTFFKTYANNIYIVSGGFKEFVIPVIKNFGISEDHVFANTFLFDKKGNIRGIDTTNPLAHDNGKVKCIKSLKLEGDITIIGDGYTDFQLKKSGIANKFIAFTENIEREIVIKNADYAVQSFDEFLYVNKLPMSLSYPKSRLTALLLENVDNDAVTILEKEGYHVEYHKKSLSEDELIEKIKNVSLLGIRSRTHLNDKVIQNAHHLLAVGAYVIGTNLIDLPSAAKKGIAIFNAPYGSTRSVVELVISEMMVLMRGIFEKSNNLHKGIWDKSADGSREIKGKTLGIIGYGTIGTQVGILAESLGMDVLFYDIVERPVLGNAERCKTLEELLKKSDIISLHVDGRPENKNLIADREFQRMKNDVIFLNASRGFVVDMDALIKYLGNGKIRGAAIDVFPKEPRSNDEPFVSPLQKFPNVILTPHIGAATKEAQKNIAHFVSHKLIEFVNTGNTYLSVNLPNIQFQKNGHRLLHIHNNVPGTLAKINNVFAENNINILGQQLKTNENIGYVITDVDQKYDKKILKILKQIPETIRFRILY